MADARLLGVEQIPKNESRGSVVGTILLAVSVSAITCLK